MFIITMRSSSKSLLYVFFAPIVCVIIAALFYCVNYVIMKNVCDNDSWKHGYNNLFYGLPIANITCYISKALDDESSDARQAKTIIYTFMGMIATLAVVLLISTYTYFQTVYLSLVYHFSKNNSDRTESFVECFKFKKYTLNIVYTENKIISFIVVILGAIGYILTCILVENTDPILYIILENYSFTVIVFAVKAIYDFSYEYNMRQFGSLQSEHENKGDIPSIKNQDQFVIPTQTNV